MLSTIVNTSNDPIAKIFSLLKFFIPTVSQTIMSIPIIKLHTQLPFSLIIVFAATAPLNIITAVHPTSCKTLRLEKNIDPLCPKDSFTVSIELFCVFAPMRPAKYNNTQPIMCPIIIAVIPFVKPRGANSVPVIISAIDKAAPNQISPFVKMDVFVFSMFYPFLNEQE